MSPSTARPPIVEVMLARLESAAVADHRGQKLSLRGRRVTSVIGRICDSEPLLHTERLVGRLARGRVLRGLSAVGLLCQAERILLAVDHLETETIRAFEHEARGTRLEVRALTPCAPMDPDTVCCDLAVAERNGVAAAGLDAALVLDGTTLSDVATAMEGRYPLRRLVTVAGCVDAPAVLQVPLGCSVIDLVRACGGSSDAGWIPFHNGLLGGTRADRTRTVDLCTRGIVVLPHHHPYVVRQTASLEDQVRHTLSACVSCRNCTDACPVHLNGGNLEAHRIMQALAAPGSATSTGGPVLGALECVACRVCNTVCPTMLRPADVVSEVARRLEAQGVSLTGRYGLRPHPDHASRRASVARLTESLGLSSYVTPAAQRTGQVIPERLTFPLRSPTGAIRIPTVRQGESVRLGDVIALAAADSHEPDCRSPVAGVVRGLDADEGVCIEPR
jgi:Na+-translocating ferredoxin:NAD+ oxidoreductase RnfC subunit